MPDPGAPPVERGAFAVHLDVFEGPFDLLLSLISKHQLDVTLVALSQVTDEFLAYLRQGGDDWDLGQATEFLVVAATLLDLKAARLLPAADVDDEEDLAALEARDLLFARLLQYRAFKLAAGEIAALLAGADRRYPRSVGLEPAFAQLLPEVLVGVTPDQFARVAAGALRPRPPVTVDVDHLHAPAVSVREQALLLSARLREAGAATFRTLVRDCAGLAEVVGRFLALLELYRDGAVAFEQVQPLADLHVRWVGGADPAEGTGQDGREPAAAGTPDGEVGER